MIFEIDRSPTLPSRHLFGRAPGAHGPGDGRSGSGHLHHVDYGCLLVPHRYVESCHVCLSCNWSKDLQDDALDADETFAFIGARHAVLLLMKMILAKIISRVKLNSILISYRRVDGHLRRSGILSDDVSVYAVHLPVSGIAFM